MMVSAQKSATKPTQAKPAKTTPPAADLEYEQQLFASGARTVAGIDEVGRGSMAGPVTVGVAILTPDATLEVGGLIDSKALSPARRESMVPEIRQWCAVAVGHVEPADIDRLGMTLSLRLAAQRALAELARRGYTVISGGAMGIDIAAHRAALTQQGSDLPTIAFMAGGLDRLYPAQNSDALNMIVDRGLIMSEVSVGNTPTRWRFLERNRLIAALARHTIVVEARWRSGALNTARHAMEIGRTLWAVPGQINSPNSVGTNRLLRDGLAQTLTEAADILEYDAAAGFELGTEHESEWDQAASSSALDELTERQGRV